MWCLVKQKQTSNSLFLVHFFSNLPFCHILQLQFTLWFQSEWDLIIVKVLIFSTLIMRHIFKTLFLKIFIHSETHLSAGAFWSHFFFFSKGIIKKIVASNKKEVNLIFKFTNTCFKNDIYFFFAITFFMIILKIYFKNHTKHTTLVTSKRRY